MSIHTETINEKSYTMENMGNEINNRKLFFDIILKANASELQEYLSENKFDPWSWTDDDGYNCLHKSCYMNLTECAQIIIKEIKLRNYEKIFINQFINCLSNNDFSALHFASFRGNIELIELLIENGAEIYVKNSKGLNVLHMAAQGDQPSSLVYFTQKYEMNIFELDNLQNTPLHWACYFGSEKFLNFYIYLIGSQIKTIDVQNSQGLTCLHLAVMSEKSKIIKKLLYLNANLNIRDNKSRTPYDLAVEKNKTSILKLLEDKNSYLDCVNRKKIKKEERNSFNYYLFIILHLLLESGVFFLLLPHFNSTSVTIIYICLFISVMIFFFIIKFSNPGLLNDIKYQPFTNDKSPLCNDNFLKIIMNNELIDDYCPYCIVKRDETNRIKHCYLCNTCIKFYDHHCYWVDNCIGENNLHLFFLFVTFTMINLLFQIYLSLYVLIKKNDFSLKNELENCFPPKISVLMKLHFYDEATKKFMGAGLFLFSLCFVIPLLGLFIKNLEVLVFKIRKSRKNAQNRRYDITLNQEYAEEEKILIDNNAK